MTIDYTLKEVKPNIFAVIVPNDFDRAMLFCRVQEYYESDSRQFKGEPFDFFEYMRWYASRNKGVFTYTKDWTAFNISINNAIECYNNLISLTTYDNIFDSILTDILSQIKHTKISKSYIIGVKSEKGLTYKHEILHAIYYTNNNYKAAANILTSLIPKRYYNILKDNLMSLGYHEDVIDDEVQAYMSTNYKSKYFSKGVPTEWLEATHKKYKEQSKQYLK